MAQLLMRVHYLIYKRNKSGTGQSSLILEALLSSFNCQIDTTWNRMSREP